MRSGWFVACALAAGLPTGCGCGEDGATESTGLRIDSVEPGTGPLTGGTTLDIRGGGFGFGASVLLGSAGATDVEVLAPGILRATTPPAQAAGPVDVHVVMGDDQAVLPDGFDYVAAPRIDAVEPAYGSVAGGTTVVVRGAGFVNGASLRLGQSAAQDVQWLDASTMAATTPPGEPGFVEVTAENPDGQSGTLADGFEYRELGECRLASSTPSTGASGVSITATPRLEWAVPIDGDSIENSVSLVALSPDDGTVPLGVAADGDSALMVQPERSLRFWRTYMLSAAGIRALDGTECEPAAIAFATVVPAAGPRELRPATADGLAIVGDYAITASTTYRGLQIYDISDPESVVLVGELTTTETPVNLTAAGDRLYAPCATQGVLIFDVSDPTQLVRLGRAGTPGYTRDVAAFDRDERKYLAAADGEEGVRLLDVTDPEGVVDLGALDPSGARAADVRAVDVQGDLLAIADGEYGFEVASVEDPEAPVILGRNWLGFPSTDVAIAGDVLYVGHGNLGMYSIDLTEVATLPWIEEVWGPGGPCLDYCADTFASIELSPSLDEVLVASYYTGVFRIGIDELGGMELAGWVDTPGRATRVEATGSRLLVAEDGLMVYASDVDSDDQPLWFDPNGHGHSRSIAAAGEHAYVAAGARGLQTLSLAEPEAPVLVDRDDSPGAHVREGAMNVAALGSIVALGDGRAGVTLYDASDPANPVEAGQIVGNDLVTDLAIRESVLFACADNWGVMVADISDPEAPLDLGGLPWDPVGSDQCYDLLVSGDTLFIASRLALTIADVSDAAAPTILSRQTLPAGDAVIDLALVRGHLFTSTLVADFEGRQGATHRLQVMDVSDPADPRRVYMSDDLGGAAGMAVAGDVLFLAALDIGVFVFDVSEPETPVLEGLFTMPGFAGQLEATATALYVAQGQGGVQAVQTGSLPPGQ